MKYGVKYTSALIDSSGYAAAARAYVDALTDHPELDITAAVVSFENAKTTHGPLMHKLKTYVNRQIPYRIHITHLTPPNYPQTRESNKYNIAYTVWETDKLPTQWVELCNLMDEIWVPSTWNIEVFKKSGVTKPILCVPHIVAEPDLSDAEHVSFPKGPNTYAFYSIFQWIARKGPTALLKAYLTEFAPDEDVVLALKTYRIDASAKEQNLIKQDIAAIKQSLNMKAFPPLLFFGSLLSAEHMKGLHLAGDCYVSPHAAEGFGQCLTDAAMYGKPVISTRYSGNLDFLNDENSFLINYQETPVTGMIFPHYDGTMTWAEPNIIHLRQLMRWCFEHRAAAAEKGLRAKQEILAKYNKTTVMTLMADRIKEIYRSLG